MDKPRENFCYSSISIWGKDKILLKKLIYQRIGQVKCKKNNNYKAQRRQPIMVYLKFV